MESQYKVDREKLKRLGLHTKERIEKDQELGRRILKVSSRLVKDFTQEGRNDRGHVVKCDEPPGTGGNNEGPTPLEYFLMGLGFCQLAIETIYASRMDFKIDAIEISVDGYLNVGGLYGVEGLPVNFEKITMETRIRSNEPEARAKELFDTVNTHCPASQALLNPTRVSGSLFLNGKLLVGAR